METSEEKDEMTVMPTMLDLEPPARRVALLLEDVTDDRLPSPTPCESCPVEWLLAHLLGLSAAFRDAAEKHSGPATRTPPDGGAAPPALRGDWRTALPLRLDELVRAWRSPGAWEGTTQVGGVTLPGEVAGQVALNELVLHGWDLARATGQEYTCDTATLKASMALLEQSADGAGREGIFGPVVEVPGDAPLLDRVVGLGGRDPSWTSPA